MWYLEVLEKERLKVNPLGPPRTGKSVGGAFEERILKEGNSEKIRKESITNVADTTLVMVHRAANRGNQWYTRNPRMAL